MDPYAQNQSCDPFTPSSTVCTPGNYVVYTINASTAADVTAGLEFAQKQNIRLVIKNTGHDYLGKSTGKGALGIWTHNMKEIDIHNYTSPGYTGKAVKIGAGSQAFEVYAAAAAQGLRVVGGECTTVGLAGGYLQGGGHSPLSSIYGMGADQVLEWDVVKADGCRVTASPTENTDLYWALSGGGGGTYGVVLSATVKAFEDGRVGGAFIQFGKANVSDEAFWKGVEAFHAALPALVDAGGATLHSLTNDSFVIVPLTVPGKTVEQVTELLQPFKSRMDALKLPMVLNITSFPTYYEHFDHYLGPMPYGLPLINIVDVSIAGRLIPRKVVEDPESNAAFIEALKKSVYPGGSFITGGVSFNAPHSVAGNGPSTNAVLPAWRDAILNVIAFAPWSYQEATTAQNLKAEDYLIDVTLPALKSVSPGGSAYLNEANLRQADWKQSFYGANYERLRAIKRTYDPTDLFYAETAVGSDAWTQDSDGRLCRVQ
ncbi:hypothetical protein PG995_006105 [Apiospora arundinis]